MPPVKFDDISKVAKSVLSDDYETSGYQLVGKNKTNFDGAVVTTTVDILPGKEGVQTPSKLSWKFPKLFGSGALPSIDKLEMDKSGKFKLECSANKAVHKVPDLVVDFKSDLVKPDKITSACTYTGLKDTFIKVETKPMKPADFTYEVTRAMGMATIGVKGSPAGLPAFGMRILSGPLFASMYAKEGKDAPWVVTAHAMYKVSDSLKVACTCEKGSGTKLSSATAGVEYALAKGTSVKAKMDQDTVASLSFKHELAKGVTVICGGKVAKETSYGVKLSLD